MGNTKKTEQVKASLVKGRWCEASEGLKKVQISFVKESPQRTKSAPPFNKGAFFIRSWVFFFPSYMQIPH
jgi:hypothetical protein